MASHDRAQGCTNDAARKDWGSAGTQSHKLLSLGTNAIKRDSPVSGKSDSGSRISLDQRNFGTSPAARLGSRGQSETRAWRALAGAALQRKASLREYGFHQSPGGHPTLSLPLSVRRHQKKELRGSWPLHENRAVVWVTTEVTPGWHQGRLRPGDRSPPVRHLRDHT